MKGNGRRVGIKSIRIFWVSVYLFFESGVCVAGRWRQCGEKAEDTRTVTTTETTTEGRRGSMEKTGNRSEHNTKYEYMCTCVCMCV